MSVARQMFTVLVVIGVVSSLVLAASYNLTEPLKQQNRIAALQEAIFVVLPDAEDCQRNAERACANIGGNGIQVYQGLDADGQPAGYAFVAEGPGFQGTIRMMVGVEPDLQTLFGMTVLEQVETPGLGRKLRKIRLGPIFMSNSRNYRWLALRPNFSCWSKPTTPLSPMTFRPLPEPRFPRKRGGHYQRQSQPTSSTVLARHQPVGTRRSSEFGWPGGTNTVMAQTAHVTAPLNLLAEFRRGLWTENPVFRQLLGCVRPWRSPIRPSTAWRWGWPPVLCSSLPARLCPLIRKLVPGQVRIAAFTVIIATFVTVADQVLAAFFPDISKALGPYVPLIVVNCIILGRQEAFASKNPVHKSALDAVVMGSGFIVTLTVLGSIAKFSEAARSSAHIAGGVVQTLGGDDSAGRRIPVAGHRVGRDQLYCE
jgi:Na+-translocating ferredoxin:NAD+ oxidoreductase subunit E